MTWPAEQIQIRADRLHAEKAGVYAEILVTSTAPGAAAHIHGPVNFNLTSTQSRRQLVGHLEEIVPQPWHSIFEVLCYNVVEAHRMGVEPINIASHSPSDRSGMRIDPILENREATLMFGEGDSLKSFFATFLSVLVTSGIPTVGLTPEPGKVLYLDYETDVDTFWERVNMLTTGMNIAIPDGLLYRPMLEPLADEFTRLNAIVMREGIDLVVVDSAAPAVLEPNAAEATTAFFRALRALRVTSLTLAHMTKGAKIDYPFGSTFWRNLPRSNFAIKADRTSEYEDVAISLRHTKANNGRRLNVLGYGFAFQDDMVTVTEEEPAKRQELAGDVPVWKRIFLALTSPKTVKELAEELEENPNNISQVFSRDQRKPANKRVFVKAASTEHWNKLHRE